MSEGEAAGAASPYPKEAVAAFARDWAGFDAPRAYDRGAAAENDIYFNSYSYIGIHEEMLKDSVRTGGRG